MATLAELRTRVKDNLYSSQPPEHEFVTRAGADYTTEDELTIIPGDGDSFERGDVLETPKGEQIYVTEAPDPNTIEVFRGYNGTSVQDIDTGDFLVKNPRFSIRQIEDAINSTIRELVNYGVHVFGEGDITVDVGTHIYDLSETDIVDEYGVLALYHRETNTGVPWALPFKYHRDHSGVAAQGHSLEVWDFGEVADGGTLYFTYAKLIDDPDDLLARQEEMVVNGATAKLLPKTAAPRTKDPGRHTDRTVQPGQGIRDGQWYFALFERQARSEAANVAVERTKFPNNFRTSRARRFNW